MDTIMTIQDLLMCNGSAQSVTVNLTESTKSLIAAAPELLEALEAAANILGYADINMADCPHRRAWAKARAAIAKAKGE